MPIQTKKLYYSIREVTEITGVEAHILRYWEKEFRMLTPRRSTAGVRQYQVRDIVVIKEIIDLLYNRKFTIKGAKTELRNRRTIIDQAITRLESDNSLNPVNFEIAKPDTSLVIEDSFAESTLIPLNSNTLLESEIFVPPLENVLHVPIVLNPNVTTGSNGHSGKSSVNDPSETMLNPSLENDNLLVIKKLQDEIASFRDKLSTAKMDLKQLLDLL